MNPSINIAFPIFQPVWSFFSWTKYSKAELQSANETESKFANSSKVCVSILNCENLSCQSFSVRKPFLCESISAKSYYISLVVKLNPYSAFVFSRNTLNYSKSILPILLVISSKESVSDAYFLAIVKPICWIAFDFQLKVSSLAEEVPPKLVAVL